MSGMLAASVLKLRRAVGGLGFSLKENFFLVGLLGVCGESSESESSSAIERAARSLAMAMACSRVRRSDSEMSRTWPRHRHGRRRRHSAEIPTPHSAICYLRTQSVCEVNLIFLMNPVDNFIWVGCGDRDRRRIRGCARSICVYTMCMIRFNRIIMWRL